MLKKDRREKKEKTPLNGQRLQKVIAASGLCSRRTAEEWIAAGRVKVNGRLVREVGTRVDPERDKVSVDERQIQVEAKVYYLVYKPVGYICSRDDEADRPVVFELVDETRRLVSAGRLDYHSEGALLLTNDGGLVHRLTHPSAQVPKEYEVKVKTTLSKNQIEAIETGVMLEDGPAKPIMVSPLRHTERNTWYLFIMMEGRNREIRRIVEAVGAEVLKLKRTSFAGLRIDEMEPGDSRSLSKDEVLGLQEIAGLVDASVSGGEAKRELQRDLSQLLTQRALDKAKNIDRRQELRRPGKPLSKRGRDGQNSQAVQAERAERALLDAQQDALRLAQEDERMGEAQTARGSFRSEPREDARRPAKPRPTPTRAAAADTRRSSGPKARPQTIGTKRSSAPDKRRKPLPDTRSEGEATAAPRRLPKAAASRSGQNRPFPEGRPGRSFAKDRPQPGRSKPFEPPAKRAAARNAPKPRQEWAPKVLLDDDEFVKPPRKNPARKGRPHKKLDKRPRKD